MIKWNKFVKAFITDKGYKDVLTGLGNTFCIAFFGFLIGIIIGTVIASFKIASKKSKAANVISKIGDVYVAFFRGTPIVVQLLLVYYVLFPTLGIVVDKIVIAVVTFGLNSGAYVSEIMRSGILSVDVGQTEAGRSLGLNYITTFTKIVLPQAIKNILPTLGNELITLVKDTSVVSFIAIVDLTNAFKLLGSGAYEYTVPYIMLAITYLIIILILTLVFKVIEGRLRTSDKR